MVSYESQTINSPNPIARFAHRSRIEKSLRFASMILPQGGKLLDFGAGTGSFLTAFADRRKDSILFAIEPTMSPSGDRRLKYFSSFDALPEQVDLITAFEVCEHLSDEQLQNFIRQGLCALRGGGAILISVPIMVGGVVFVKEMNRMMLFRRASEYSCLDLLKATVGKSVERPPDRRPTHKGFDFRELREVLKSNLRVEREYLSPLSLPWWLSSQVFFVCRGKSA